ncbi:hypothetical protein M1271_02155 [Patescibacteria group bacterium]|nr:hypothetical protein [Patescibacteria group bacterium]MCL5798336.1 hypothetical protein [Patescibacteria group bacterium]
MKRIAQTFCPASISLMFGAVYKKDPLQTGSVGIGFTVNKKIEVRIQRAQQTSIVFNGKKIIFSTVQTVLDTLVPKEHVKVEISSPLPLGFGFGISGAAALTTASAISNLYKLGKSKEELVQIAHTAEIVNRTGLGTVGTQILGGFLLKTAAGLPVRAVSFPFVGQNIYAVVIKRLPTESVLNNKNKTAKINLAAEKALEKIKKLIKPSLEGIIDIAYSYAIESSLVSNQAVANVIGKIKQHGGHATMAMVGQTVVSTIDPTKLTGFAVQKLKISNNNMVL